MTAAQVTELKAIRDALWNKSRSPSGEEEQERYELARRLNDVIDAVRSAVIHD